MQVCRYAGGHAGMQGMGGRHVLRQRRAYICIVGVGMGYGQCCIYAAKASGMTALAVEGATLYCTGLQVGQH